MDGFAIEWNGGTGRLFFPNFFCNSTMHFSKELFGVQNSGEMWHLVLCIRDWTLGSPDVSYMTHVACARTP